MFVSIKKFNAFYDENRNKLQMPQTQNYPINYKKALRWAESHCNEESRQFAAAIIRLTNYISFPEFMSALTSVVAEYVDRIEPDELQVLLIPGTLSKSNTWVSLLAYPLIRKYITHICDNVNGIYKETLNKASPLYGRKLAFIVMDDCSYTGSQLAGTLSFDKFALPLYAEEIGHTRKKWLDWRDAQIKYANELISNIKTVKIHALIPFTTSNAYNFLSTTIPHIVMSPLTTIIPKFQDEIDISKIRPAVLNEFRSTFQYHEIINAIYFDHKVADGVSTFNKIYMLAPIFGCIADHIPSYRFIENCASSRAEPSPMEEMPNRDARPNIYEYIIDVEKKYGKKAHVCPRTFYKQIDYRFGGKKIPSNLSIFDFLV
jgi:hypothetical protein